jgi:PadR family transcriptional regulator, regulatory protein PadR
MAADGPRLSKQGLVVLRLFVDRPTVALAGSDIIKAAGLFSGTVYQILFRLERAGWLTSKWEQAEPNEIGRPRKRLYRLTALGEQNSRAAFSELGLSSGRLAWNF